MHYLCAKRAATWQAVYYSNDVFRATQLPLDSYASFITFTCLGHATWRTGLYSILKHNFHTEIECSDITTVTALLLHTPSGNFNDSFDLAYVSILPPSLLPSRFVIIATVCANLNFKAPSSPTEHSRKNLSSPMDSRVGTEFLHLTTDICLSSLFFFQVILHWLKYALHFFAQVWPTAAFNWTYRIIECTKKMQRGILVGK